MYCEHFQVTRALLEGLVALTLLGNYDRASHVRGLPNSCQAL